MPQSTHDIEVVTGEDTHSMKSDFDLGPNGVFKPPNQELTPKKHRALANLNQCIGIVCRDCGPVTTIHVDPITP